MQRRVLASRGGIACTTHASVGASRPGANPCGCTSRSSLGPPWRVWFVEALVVGLVVVAALSRSRVVAEWDRRHPLGLPLALTAVAFVVFRVPVLPLPVPRMQGSALVVMHLLLLGWALARARTPHPPTRREPSAAVRRSPSAQLRRGLT